jgi:hypothetical protein
VPIPKGAVEIPFPLSHRPGSHGQESGGQIINAYAEALSETAPNKRIYRRHAGLATWGTTARSGFRGAVEIQGTYFAAFNGQLEKWTTGAGGASTNVGALSGTKPGFFAFNNASPSHKVFVDIDGNIATFTTTTVTNSYPDGDLPAVNSVCAIDGYLVFTTGSGRAYATDLNSTSVNALSFGAAESKSDGLVRGVAYAGNLFLFSTTPFPFSRSTVIPRGLAGPLAVAGMEDAFGSALVWIGDDNCTYRLNGYTPEKISPPELDALVEAVADKSTLWVSVYIARGHPFVVVSSNTFTWLFDLNTQQWTVRVSHGLTRWRGMGGTHAFTTKWLVGDTQTGNIREVTSSAADEVGSPLRVRLESGPVEKFPTGQRVGRADFNFVTGVGIASGIDPIQTDPTVEIWWSDDGGNTWQGPLPRKLGRQGITQGLISLVANTGRSAWNGRRWRLDISDPVDVGFMAATQAENARSTG